jgi:hypothetical protein
MEIINAKWTCLAKKKAKDIFSSRRRSISFIQLHVREIFFNLTPFYVCFLSAFRIRSLVFLFFFLQICHDNPAKDQRNLTAFKMRHKQIEILLLIMVSFCFDRARSDFTSHELSWREKKTL